MGPAQIRGSRSKAALLGQPQPLLGQARRLLGQAQHKAQHSMPAVPTLSRQLGPAPSRRVPLRLVLHSSVELVSSENGMGRDGPGTSGIPRLSLIMLRLLVRFHYPHQIFLGKSLFHRCLLPAQAREPPTIPLDTGRTTVAYRPRDIAVARVHRPPDGRNMSSSEKVTKKAEWKLPTLVVDLSGSIARINEDMERHWDATRHSGGRDRRGSSAPRQCGHEEGFRRRVRRRRSCWL